MKERKQDIVVGIGELLWDCFDNLRRPGGAPANVAYHASQLGYKGVVCSRVGRDEAGSGLVEYLNSRGMEIGQIQRDDSRPTGWVTVDISERDAPSYMIHEDVAWDYLELDEALESLMKTASAVCFGTLAQRQVTSRQTIRRALHSAANAVIVYDVNLRPPFFQKEWIEESLAAANIAKLNDHEFMALSEMLGTKDLVPTLIERYQVDMVCVTRGERGCSLYTSSHSVDEPGVIIEVVDAVGAGDAFSAALISSRLRGWPLHTTAWFATQVGALVASRPGAMPELREELQRLMTTALDRISSDPAR